MKHLISIVLILGILVSLAGCAAGQPVSPAAEAEAVAASVETEAVAAPEKTEAAASAETKETGYPVTLTDQAGRNVTIAAKPERIITSHYISTSALLALGLKDRLVGIENNAGKRPIYGLCAPELLALPGVGTAKELDIEGCLALNPELVILPLRLKTAAEELEMLGIPVLLINPESQELLLSMIDLIAHAAGVQEREASLLAFLQAQADSLAGITGEKPTVYLAGNSSLLSTAGPLMYQSSMIGQAGGVNAAAEITDTYWAEISYEQLLAWDPEYIILASDAVYTVEDVLNDENLASCRAVVNGNVFHVPGDVEAWDSPVPGGILGALWLASVLHPDAVTPEAASNAAAEFYGEFYDASFA